MFAHLFVGVMCLFLFGRMLILFKRLGVGAKPRVLRELIILFMITFIMPFLTAYFLIER